MAGFSYQGAAQFLPAWTACPSPQPLLSLVFRPCVCFVFESWLLSLVLRLGTHCACFHGHWEALSTMCFKGNLSPPSAASACPRRPHNKRLLGARPLTLACQEENLASAERGCETSQAYLSAKCMDVHRAGTHRNALDGTGVSCAPLQSWVGYWGYRLVRVWEPFCN